ncbi:MAG TPA: acyltransferase [Spirochaetota bacterium]|nr:acyltransferase [Spirochaetota bacterium]
MKLFKRESYLDNLRSVIILLVVFHHSAEAYSAGSGAWPVKDASSIINGIEIFQTVNGAFFMGLLFFISGFVIPGAYKKYGAKAFALSKIKRLMIPFLVFALFVFVPINYVFGHFEDIASYASYLITSDGIQSFTGHLWFVLHLFIYSSAYLICEMIYSRVNSPKTQWIMPKKLIKGKNFFLGIMLFVILISTLTFMVRIFYQIDTWIVFLHAIRVEPANIIQYLSLFTAGVVFSKKEIFDRISEKTSIVCSVFGFSVFVLSYILYYASEFFGAEILRYTGGDSLNALYRPLWENSLAVFFGIGLIYLFKRKINTDSKIWKYLSLHSYGVYIIHVIPLVGIQMALMKTGIDPLLKFLIASAVTAVTCYFDIWLLRKIRILKEYI